MATLTGGTVAGMNFFEFRAKNDYDGDFTSFTSTRAVEDTGGGYTVTFTGSGFTADSSGNPTGGTVTGIEEKFNGATTYTVTGLNIQATTLLGWVSTDNTNALLNAAFGGDDIMTGTTFGDYLLGYGGHDNMFGGAGADTLSGGDGNDHIYGQSANGGTDGADSIDGGSGADYIQGNAGTDTLSGGSGSDRINGGGDNDTIFGGDNNDTVNGNLGNDSIDGGSGNDSLRGGQGNDTIIGGEGDDVISGDLGVDRLSGGNGRDNFVFAGSSSPMATPDVIADFSDGNDWISLGFSVTSVLRGNATDLASATSAAQSLLSGSAQTSGEVAFVTVGSDSYLFYSSSNGASADSAVQIIGNTAQAFTTADFL